MICDDKRLLFVKHYIHSLFVFVLSLRCTWYSFHSYIRLIIIIILRTFVHSNIRTTPYTAVYILFIRFSYLSFRCSHHNRRTDGSSHRRVIYRHTARASVISTDSWSAASSRRSMYVYIYIYIYIYIYVY